MKATLSDIARLVQGEVIGDTTLQINNISSIDHILPNSLVFAENNEGLVRAEASEAIAILTRQDAPHTGKPLLRVTHPFKAFIQLLTYFYPTPKPEPTIHPSAVIAPDAILGKNVFIGPFVQIETGAQIGEGCVIKSHVSVGQNVVIGNNTTLHPHVTLYDKCQIGSEVTIHANTVIGSDGFGYKFIDGQHMKVPHCGHVIVEDQVEIGANTVIDRAPLGATVIGKGTKIDNLVQVAHAVKLGQHNILCAFTGVAGSTTSGDRVIFAANVGVSDHVTIDNDVILGARAGVPPKKHLLQGQIYLGNPARPKDKAIEQELSSTRIPIMRKNLRNLTETVKNLSERLEALEQCEQS